MGKATWIKVGTTWKQATHIWRNNSGVWEPYVVPWINVGGTWKDCHVLNAIKTDVNTLNADWQSMSYSGYCAINVIPDSMSITLTKVDTGDGTIWASVSPSFGTGDFSFRCRVLSDNGATPRSMNILITDDASLASSKTIILTQMAQPI